MKRKEIKEKAQEMLMNSIAIAYYGVEKMDLSEEEEKELLKELKKQADRVAKLFGYDESWTL